MEKQHFVPVAELFSRPEELKLISGEVHIEDNGDISIGRNAVGIGYPYWIEAGSLKTFEDLGDWMHQLHGKYWCTPEILWDVCTIFGTLGWVKRCRHDKKG